MNHPKIQPRRDWALVMVDARQERVGSLFLPQQELGIEKVTERVGTIIRLGKHDKLVDTLGLKEGDRVVYRGFIKEHAKVDHEGREYFLLDVADILAVTDGSVEIGCFSGSDRPAMRAVESVDDEGNVRMAR